jgi:nitrogen fixation protein FixH
MKLNWGFSLLIFILLFMAFILTLVYKCSKQRVDLVSSAYYEQELKYNDQMAKENNTSRLTDSIYAKYDLPSKQVVINYPPSVQAKKITGTLHFFKPDNALLDFSKDITPDEHSLQSITATSMEHGRWNIKMDWKEGEKEYYKEDKIFIN